MPDKYKTRIEIGVLALVFGAGGGWATYEVKLSALEQRLENIELRVQDIYCATVPEEKRAGCR